MGRSDMLIPPPPDKPTNREEQPEQRTLGKKAGLVLYRSQPWGQPHESAQRLSPCGPHQIRAPLQG